MERMRNGNNDEYNEWAVQWMSNGRFEWMNA